MMRSPPERVPHHAFATLICLPSGHQTDEEPIMSKKRPLDGFFKPQEAKKPRFEGAKETSNHETYPFPIAHLPPSIEERLSFAPEEVCTLSCIEHDKS
jgi:hypothetical protein